MSEFHINRLYLHPAGRGLSLQFLYSLRIVVEPSLTGMAADYLPASSNSIVLSGLLLTEGPETQVLKLSYIFESFDPKI